MKYLAAVLYATASFFAADAQIANSIGATRQFRGVVRQYGQNEGQQSRTAQKRNPGPTQKPAAQGPAGDGNKKKKKKKKKSKPQKDKRSTEYVFNRDTTHSYNLIIDPNQKAILDADPGAEEYVPCSVQIDYGKPNAKTFNGCGCRYKGSVGSLRICLDPATGRMNDMCRKLSWKVDANKYIPEGKNDDQRILGQKKLNFNGLAVDMSLVSERLSYDLIQEAEMVGPLSTNSFVYVNGRFDGVYSMVENPDEVFTKRNFKKDDNKGRGALYKDALIESTNPAYYESLRKTDQDEDDFMVEVARAAKRATPQTADAFFERYFDVESIINVTAINSLIGMTDDWRRRHNFFWYVREDEVEGSVYRQAKGDGKQDKETVKKLVMIPWDYDRINDANAGTRAPPGSPHHWWDQMNTKLSYCRQDDPSPKAMAGLHPSWERDYWLSFYEAMPPDMQKPINCDHFTQLMAAALKDRVIERTEWLAENVVTMDHVKSTLAFYMRQISPKVGINDLPSKPDWKVAVQDLYTYLKDTRKSTLSNLHSSPRMQIGFSTTPLTGSFQSSATATLQSIAQSKNRGATSFTSTRGHSSFRQPTQRFG